MSKETPELRRPVDDCTLDALVFQGRSGATESWASRGLDVSGYLPYAPGQEVPIMIRSTSAQRVTSSGRAERLEARISSDQKALFQRAAELQGRTLTDFVVSSVQEAAVRTIEEMQIIRLSAEDSVAFADALLHPRTPKEKLLTAARRYVESMGG